MKVRELKEILSNADSDGEVVIGVWFEQCRDTPAHVGVSTVEHVRFPESDSGERNPDRIVIVANP